MSFFFLLRQKMPASWAEELRLETTLLRSLLFVGIQFEFQPSLNEERFKATFKAVPGGKLLILAHFSNSVPSFDDDNEEEAFSVSIGTCPSSAVNEQGRKLEVSIETGFEPGMEPLTSVCFRSRESEDSI